jgi:hypothetical protein
MGILPQRVRHHAVITGTGRAGTSFIVQLLSELGKDTGFETLFSFNETAKAGLEFDIRKDNAPYIVKNPAICNYIDEILANQTIVIDHVFIPVRNLEAAARSRVAVQERFGVSKPVPGGLWLTDDPQKQATVLAAAFHNLICALTRAEIRMTFLAYPRLSQDCDYLYGKLQPLVSDIDRNYFGRMFDKVRRPEWMHRFSDADK